MVTPDVATITRVLVVEDDRNVSEVLERYLRLEGYQVEVVGDGLRAIELARSNPFDLVVLDIMLPGADGLEVCRALRKNAPTPVIMLTALGEESDRIVGLDIGADDYMTKPFSPRELTARVKAVLRRAGGGLGGQQASLPETVAGGDIDVDLRSRQARVKGLVAALTAREFDLLAFFMTHPRYVFTREELLEKVWGYSYGDTSTITVHVRRLRSKVEADPSAPRHITTVWGVGYRFEP